MFPEMSKQCTLVDSPPIVFAESATSVAANCQYQGQCTVCVELIHEKRLIGDRRFVLMENCWDILCLQCPELLKLQRMDQILCPVCGTGSKGFVDLDRSVCSDDEKRKLFSNQTNVTSLIQIKILNDFKELRCQLCSLEVRKNPDNPGSKFGILQYCRCIFCASCIAAKHSKDKTDCPVCFIASKRVVNHFEFVSIESEKSALFVEQRPKIKDSALRCQLCLLVIRNNPGDHLFGILENCQCVFCAGCIEEQRRITRKCPVCNTNSRRVLNQSEFISSSEEKQSFYASLLSSVQNLLSTPCAVDRPTSLPPSPLTVESQLSQPGSSKSISLPLSTNAQSIPKTINGNSVPCPEPNVPDSGFRCQLCSLEVQNNPANPGGQFAITTSCFCVICASCITDDQRRLKKCPVCNQRSKRIENNSQFIRLKKEKHLFFDSIPTNILYNKPRHFRRLRLTLRTMELFSNLVNQLPTSQSTNNPPPSPTEESQLSQPTGPSESMSQSTEASSQNSFSENDTFINTNELSISETIIYQNSMLCSKPNVPDSGLRCQLCFFEVQNNPANPGGLFGILRNCCCIFCASCISAKHSDQNKACPDCLISSKQHVNCAVFITPDSEKVRILFSTNEEVPDSELRCTLCWKVVQNNPGGQFAITAACFCVICSSCITDDHRQSMRCPVCNRSSKRIENNSQFIRSIKDKRLVFQKRPIISTTSKALEISNLVDEELRCQLCSLKVRNNSGGQFAITTSCFCVICANCITEDHHLLKRCPVCNKKCKRIENHSKFIRLEKEKQLFFNKTPKRRRFRKLPSNLRTMEPKILVDSKELRCQLCSLEVQNNPANPGGQFAITTSCFCVICISCITDDQRRLKKCPVCNQPSNRIENHSQFIRLERKKQLFFNKTPKRRRFKRLRSNRIF